MAIRLSPTFKMNLRHEQFLLVLRLFSPSIFGVRCRPHVSFCWTVKSTCRERPRVRNMANLHEFIRVNLLMSPVDGKKSFTPSLKSQTSGQQSYRLFFFGKSRVQVRRIFFSLWSSVTSLITPSKFRDITSSYAKILSFRVV